MNISFLEVKERFLKDGFVVLPAIVSKNKLFEINKKLEEAIKQSGKMKKSQVIGEEVNGLVIPKQIQDLQLYDELFAKLLDIEFKGLAETLLNDQVIGKTVEYFNKFPGTAKPTPPHQDGFYFMLEPSQALTVWIALEDIDEENGCLRYARGSHRYGMREHSETNTTGFSQGISDYGKMDFQREVAVPAKAGDVLIHHSLTVHRADANSSKDRTRKALGLIYFAKSVKEDAERKNKYLEALSKKGK